MKILKTLLFFIILPVLLAGCLQVETTLHVNKDGSGTINEKVLLSKTFVNMLKEFAQSFQDSASTEEFSLFKEDEIKVDAKDYGENVQYVSHEFVSKDNWEGYTVIYSFDDVTKIKLRPDPDNKVDVGMEGEETTQEEDYYFFKFVKGDVAELIIDRPDIDIKVAGEEENEIQESEGSDEEMGDEFLKMMEGMSINIAVEVDGSIVNTDASYVENSKITLLQMDFGEMMKNKEDFKEFKDKEPKNIEEMKEFLEKFPGMKLEIEKPVTIKFK